MEESIKHKAENVLKSYFRRMVISSEPLQGVYQRACFAHFHGLFQVLGGAVCSYDKTLDEFLRDGVEDKLLKFQAIKTLKEEKVHAVVNLLMEYELLLMAFCVVRQLELNDTEMPTAAMESYRRLKLSNNQYVEDTIRLLDLELNSGRFLNRFDR